MWSPSPVSSMPSIHRPSSFLQAWGLLSFIFHIIIKHSGLVSHYLGFQKLYRLYITDISYYQLYVHCLLVCNWCLCAVWRRNIISKHKFNHDVMFHDFIRISFHNPKPIFVSLSYNQLTIL